MDCCYGHERQTYSFLALPASDVFLVGAGEGGFDYGDRPRPLCGDGCVEAGREGVRPGRRAGSSQDGGDGPHVGLDDERVLQLREHLIAEQVSLVVMEATGDYWKPFVRHEALWNRVEVR